MHIGSACPNNCDVRNSDPRINAFRIRCFFYLVEKLKVVCYYEVNKKGNKTMLSLVSMESRQFNMSTISLNVNPFTGFGIVRPFMIPAVDNHDADADTRILKFHRRLQT